jgi:CheY-like chemotaxis protein
VSLTEITSLFLPSNFFSDGAGVGRQTPTEKIRSRQLRVLVTDNESEFRESMVYLLTEIFEAKASEAKSGREAVELVKDGEAFNIIFLDLIMPRMDGLITYDELRKAGASCPIVIMSAHRDSSQWKEAESRGLELLDKPIYVETLTTILSDL